MISHKHKCIFIHLPRTGGSFIEKLITGKQLWKTDLSTKHLLASQAKEKYKDYWDEYFKFSFVRHPYKRFISMLKFSDYFFGEENLNKIDLKHLEFYKKKFNSPKLIELDLRFHKFEELNLMKYSENQIYLNFLDEKIDFIGKYENFEMYLNYIFKKINFKFWKIKSLFVKKKMRLASSPKIENLENEVREEIYKIQINDFKYFKYSR